MPFRFPQSRAFTLIELIATIAVLAAITTAGLFFVGSYVQSAKQNADKQTLFVLNDALNRYKTQGGGVAALTSGAPIKNVLARLQTPVSWNGLTHQVLQTGKTFLGRSIDALGSGSQYRFTRFNTFTTEAGGTSPDGIVSFVVVSQSTTATAYSGDGTNWIAGTMPASLLWNGVQRMELSESALRRIAVRSGLCRDSQFGGSPERSRSEKCA